MAKVRLWGRVALVGALTACSSARPLNDPTGDPAGCYELRAAGVPAADVVVPDGFRLFSERRAEQSDGSFRATTTLTGGREGEHPFDRWHRTEEGLVVHGAGLSGAVLRLRAEGTVWSGTLKYFSDLRDQPAKETEVEARRVACPEPIR